MKLVKYVPNTLSVLRILLSFILPLLARSEHRLGFVLLYFFIGSTDALDGMIARRYDLETSFGAKLDAIGDSLFFAAAVASLLLAGLDLQPYGVLMYLLVLTPPVVYKLANVAVTKKRFGEWNMMHTLCNRFVFVSLACFVPVFIVLDDINFWMVVGAAVAICLACLEETITLFKIEEYHVGHNGILGAKILRKDLRGG